MSYFLYFNLLSHMYRSQVGSLMYFTETRHDISYEVSRISQGLAAPTRGHMKAIRRVMAYLNIVPGMRLHVYTQGCG